MLPTRRIAALTLGVFKSGKKYKPYGERKNVNNNKPKFHAKNDHYIALTVR